MLRYFYLATLSMSLVSLRILPIFLSKSNFYFLACKIWFTAARTSAFNLKGLYNLSTGSKLNKSAYPSSNYLVRPNYINN